MRVPSYLKRKYRDLIEQLKELAATKEKGYKEYKKLSKHIRLK